MFRFNILLLLAIVIALFHSDAAGENWPGWRGPRGDGSSLDQNPPTQWDGVSGTNIAWRITTPGKGHASPIIWGNRIFLASCRQESTERMLVCLNRDTGSTLWQRTVFDGPLESIHALNSHASATPVTDGETVYVTFLQVAGSKIPAPNVGTPRLITPGQMVVAAYDFEGNQKWLVKPGGFISAHGFCNCPILYGNLVIINGDHDGDSYIVALDKKTGVERWRLDRENKIRSYVTPIIREIDGRTQMVFSGSKHILSLDPRDGSTHWKIDGPTEQFVASLVYDGRLFFMACGFPDYFVMGIRPDGQGNVTDSHVAWQSRSARCYVPSPVVLKGYLLVADDRGTGNCFDTRSGERLWQARPGKGYSASLAHADGLAYFIAQDGVTKVIRPGEKLDIVAQNELGENVSASPAFSDGQILVRSESSLFCIGTRSNP